MSSAWVVVIKTPEGTQRRLGVKAFARGPLPAWHTGFMTATFGTREMAREAAKRFPYARVARVSIEMKEVSQ